MQGRPCLIHINSRAFCIAMPILEVHKADNRQLQNIANTLAAAKKVVVVTGAGISTNCGIPVCDNGYSAPLPCRRSLITSYRTSDPKKAFTPSYKHSTTLSLQATLSAHHRKEYRSPHVLTTTCLPRSCHQSPQTSKAKTSSMPNYGKIQLAHRSSTDSSPPCERPYAKMYTAPHRPTGLSRRCETDANS
jgi:hypothetical protein